MFKNKQILFIGRNFFGYDKVIFEYLRVRGAEVDYVSDVPYFAPLAKAALRTLRFIMINDASRRILQQVESFGRTHYDYVFVIIGEGLNQESLRILRSNYCRATFILHIWDAIQNNREPLIPNFQFFDTVSSFDRGDATRLSLQFRPLFFSKGYETTSSISNLRCYDVSFVGTAHSDRSPILSLLKRNLEERERRYFIFQYLQAKWLYYLYNAFDGRYRGIPIEQFSFQSLSQTNVAEIGRSSNVIVDIPHLKQEGLTIRTLECLGLGRKIATTNRTIIGYDFYRPENIFLLDRTNPIIPDSFFEGDYVNISTEILQKYTLEGWITDIFSPSNSRL